MKSHSPTKEERDWMDAIRQMGCIVCLQEWDVITPAEIHHIAGKTKKYSHLLTIPLCYHHHRSGEDNERFTSRHPFKRRFEERYGYENHLYHDVYQKVFGQRPIDVI